jgi:hypothetical protein
MARLAPGRIFLSTPIIADWLRGARTIDSRRARFIPASIAAAP